VYAAPKPMKYSPILLLTAPVLLALSTHAYAQDPGGSPTTPQRPNQNTSAQPTPNTPVAPEGAERFCELGDVSGVDPGEAAVAARLICDEVWRATKSRPEATYRVAFGKLGGKIVVRLEGTDRAGVRDERHLELLALDEVSLAASRLADALVEKKTLQATESARNVLATNTKMENQKRGATKLEAGVIGTAVLGPKWVAPAPGLYMQLAYITERAALVAGLRFGVGTRSQNFGLHAGADYHLSDGDLAPFIGGGAAWTVMGVQPEGEPKLSASGFGVYAQAGITAFRTSRSNFRVGLRADVPLFTLEGVKPGTPGSVQTGASTPATSFSIYSIPLSLTVGVALF
jgi:hypothetical protein